MSRPLPPRRGGFGPSRHSRRGQRTPTLPGPTVLASADLALSFPVTRRLSLSAPPPPDLHALEGLRALRHACSGPRCLCGLGDSSSSHEHTLMTHRLNDAIDVHYTSMELLKKFRSGRITHSA